MLEWDFVKAFGNHCVKQQSNTVYSRTKKKRKVNRQMAGECQLNKQSGSWVIFFVFFFICLDGFLLCDSFCFQFSLHTGEQRKITGEVSFYICAVRGGFMKMFLGESRKRKTLHREDELHRKEDWQRWGRVKAWDEKILSLVEKNVRETWGTEGIGFIKTGL